MRQPIFKDLQPLENSRTTRSRLKQQQQTRRTINMKKAKDNFEHFCSIPINTRISQLPKICNYSEMESPKCSKKFLEYRNIADPMKATVTLLSQSDLKAHVAGNVNNNNTKAAVKKDEVIDITDDDVKETNVCVENVDVNVGVDNDDDVILIPSVHDEPTIILLDDTVTDRNQPITSTPKTTKKIKLEGKTVNNNENNVHSSVIEILDNADDIVFVNQETRNKKFKDLKFHPSNIKKSPSSTDRKSNRRKKKNSLKVKSLSMKNRRKLKKASIQFLANGAIKKVLHEHLKEVNFPQPVREQNKINSPPFSHKMANRVQMTQKSPNLSLSFSNFESNMCNIRRIKRTGLREIIIDGSNVAMGHSNHRFFSVKGLQIAIEYFLKKGHKVTAFVPQYRQKYNQTSDCGLLNKLADKGYVVFTPSREVNGKRITPYDDRYIIQYAATCQGIVVSSDNYRDLFLEKPEWRETIEKRLLMPTWIGDVLMFPEDPLGRAGPSLTSFLRFS